MVNPENPSCASPPQPRTHFPLRSPWAFARIASMIARILMTASAGVILALGMIHLVYTFHGPKLAPRDPSVQEKMQQGSLVLSGEINVWKAWVGFNASHSFGLVLFGL